MSGCVDAVLLDGVDGTVTPASDAVDMAGDATIAATDANAAVSAVGARLSSSRAFPMSMKERRRSQLECVT